MDKGCWDMRYRLANLATDVESRKTGKFSFTQQDKLWSEDEQRGVCLDHFR